MSAQGREMDPDLHRAARAGPISNLQAMLAKPELKKLINAKDGYDQFILRYSPFHKLLLLLLCGILNHVFRFRLGSLSRLTPAIRLACNEPRFTSLRRKALETRCCFFSNTARILRPQIEIYGRHYIARRRRYVLMRVVSAVSFLLSCYDYYGRT